MAEVYKITKGDKASWNFEVDGETYSLPVGKSMPVFMLERLERHTVRDLIEILKKYIPAEVVDGLTADEVNQIFEGLNSATKELTGASLGKS